MWSQRDVFPVLPWCFPDDPSWRSRLDFHHLDLGSDPYLEWSSNDHSCQLAFWDPLEMGSKGCREVLEGLKRKNDNAVSGSQSWYFLIFFQWFTVFPVIEKTLYFRGVIC